MKSEQYVVDYSVIIQYEAILRARNKVEAIKKVVEVVGKPIEIHSARKLMVGHINNDKDDTPVGPYDKFQP